MKYYRLKWVNGDYLGLGFNSKGKHKLKVEILEDLKDTEEEFYEDVLLSPSPYRISLGFLLLLCGLDIEESVTPFTKRNML
jgi:hypothetical protein